MKGYRIRGRKIRQKTQIFAKDGKQATISQGLTDVIFDWRQELGRLESLCFFKICRTRTSLGPEAVAGFLRLEDRSSASSGSFSMLSVDSVGSTLTFGGTSSIDCCCGCVTSAITFSCNDSSTSDCDGAYHEVNPEGM